MKYKVISTGSKGNAVIVNDLILVDCGIPYKQLVPFVGNLRLVLLTHKHSDHFRHGTIKKLSETRPMLRFGCCEWLLEAMLDAGVPRKRIDVYEIGKVYDYRSFRISPVRLYHDVPNAGYRIYMQGEKAIYATDTARLDGISAKGYDLYLLEANYLEEEIREKIREKEQNGEFVYEYRVLRTHLSKEQCDAFLFENMKDSSVYQYLHCHRDEHEENT